MEKIYRNLCVLGLLTLAVALMPALGLSASDRFYEQHNLVSNNLSAIPADHTDTKLVNAWGIAFNPNAVVWIADNGTGFATLYDGSGVAQSLVVTIPVPPGNPGPGNPTGIVFNGSSDFVINKDSTSGPSVFIFASENGSLSGWSPVVDPTQAILVVNNSSSGVVYKGLALAANGTGHFLYATDFHNAKIDVFDNTFKPVTLSGSFSDPDIPEGFAPFGIQNLNGNLYVTYAKQDAEKHDDVQGKGLGFVNVFDANGNLIRRVASRGKLNAPWGLAMAPANFGKFSNRLLVGNFGDGTVNAFDVATDRPVGQLQTADGKVLKIDGLWGLSFGNGVRNQPTDVLFFTAGPNEENDGLYGRIEPVSP